MSSKRWLVMFALTVGLVLGLCAGLNILTDPFGVFGDPVLNWYSYDETNNPRTAKLAWLERHHPEFDSYIIGSSSAASYNVEELNAYLDAKFYNLFVYGSDTKDYRDFVAYLLENCEVKHILLNLGINEANLYDTGEGDLNNQMHALVSGRNLFGFYLDYAFSNLRYASDKLQARWEDTELPQVFDVFHEPSGCYDKRLRDIEKIGDMTVYQAAHGADFYMEQNAPPFPHIEQCIQSVSDIRDMCRQAGVELTVIFSPIYISQWTAYSQETLRQYKIALAQVTDYWDFSLTPLSSDSRFFYDASHFRNALGTMVLGEVFDNPEVWRPENFGYYVTAENCGTYLEEVFENPPTLDGYTADVPILLYHHITDSPASDTEVTPETFESHIRALAEAGCTAVTAQDMIDFVYHGGDLPEKPVWITLDDGYYSNYEYAWPILQKYGMKATVFAIGVSVGCKEFYKDTDYPITPHFNWSEAREMSDVVDIQSHTYDLHQWKPYESGEFVRNCALPFADESDLEYAAVLTADLECYDRERINELGEGFSALAYPGGQFNEWDEVLIHQYGIPITLSCRTDSRNILVRGLPQSLYALCRWNIPDAVTAEKVLEIAGIETLSGR